MSTIAEVSDSTFHEAVLESQQPVLLEFTADWCGPCHQIAKVLEQVDDERPGLTVVKMKYDENTETPTRYRILGLPTMLLFVGGEPIASITGAKPKSVLLRLIDEAVEGTGSIPLCCEPVHRRAHVPPSKITYLKTHTDP